MTDAPEKLDIRPYRCEDRAPLVALWDAAGLVRPWNDPGRDIDRKLAVGDDLLLVGLLRGRLVASVMAGYEGHRGWVNYLAVEPQLQGRGLGAEIMADAERRLRSLGCPKINLQIRTGNVEAARFYQRIGYTGDDVVSMSKRLVDDETGGGR